MHVGDVNLTEAQYLKVIEYKTAKLFEAAARLPAVIAGDTVAELALASYGRKVGAAFQIIDDVLDYEGDAAKLGKNVGDDLREGKVTLPLIYAMQKGNMVQRQTIENAIALMQSGHASDESCATTLTAVVQTVQELGAIQQARLAADGLLLEAKQALQSLADASVEPCTASLPSAFKGIEQLSDLALQAVSRSS
jgi:octaprenyl-diphosphate synthase